MVVGEDRCRFSWQSQTLVVGGGGVGGSHFSLVVVGRGIGTHGRPRH